MEKRINQRIPVAKESHVSKQIWKFLFYIEKKNISNNGDCSACLKKGFRQLNLF